MCRHVLKGRAMLRAAINLGCGTENKVIKDGILQIEDFQDSGGKWLADLVATCHKVSEKYEEQSHLTGSKINCT